MTSLKHTYYEIWTNAHVITSDHPEFMEQLVNEGCERFLQSYADNPYKVAMDAAWYYMTVLYQKLIKN